MATIARDAIPAVVLPEEVVAVAALGGDVIVRGMDLPQMLRFNAARRRAVQPQEGETDDAEVAERFAGQMVPLVLSMCVLADDGLPVYSEAQWSVWSVQHIDGSTQLLKTALRLSGQGGDEKKD